MNGPKTDPANGGAWHDSDYCSTIPAKKKIDKIVFLCGIL